MARLIPGNEVPALTVPLVGGGQWTLGENLHKRFTVIEFYRGYHCPRCRRRLQEIDKRLDELAERDASFFAQLGNGLDGSVEGSDGEGNIDFVDLLALHRFGDVVQAPPVFDAQGFKQFHALGVVL